MEALVSYALILWVFAAVAVLPRFAPSLQTLAVISLVVGAALAWAAGSVGQHPPYYVSVMFLIVALATGLGMVHWEIIFRRKNGFWRLLEPNRPAGT